MARPSSFRPEIVPQVKAMAAAGATQREIAEYLGIGERTLDRWRAEHPELAQEMRLGKEFADNRVELSLYKKAVGFSYDSEKVFVDKGVVVRVPVVEHVQPDTTACIFFLKNRRRQQWRDKQEVEHSGTVEGAPSDLALRLGTTLASMSPAAPNRKRTVQ